MAKVTLRTDYRDDASCREAFFTYTETVFPGISFRNWFDRGFWPDEYVPYSIMENGVVVSNVSITKMKIWLDGHLVNGIQIGTVGTIPEYRNRGLSRLLMEHVLDRHETETDLFFLFANDSVIDFYTRFGFRRSQETGFRCTSNIPIPNFSARRLHIDSDADMALVRRLLSSRRPVTRLFGASEYDGITLWHVLNIFPERLVYLEDDDIIFIVSQKEKQLHVWDIIFDRPFDLAVTLPKVIAEGDVESIHYYFSPDELGYSPDVVELDEDSLLFVRGDFPIDGRAFKFPVTAQT